MPSRATLARAQDAEARYAAAVTEVAPEPAEAETAEAASASATEPAEDEEEDQQSRLKSRWAALEKVVGASPPVMAVPRTYP